MEDAGFPILTMLIVIPAVGAALTALSPRRRPELVRLVGLLASVLTGALSIWLLVEFDTDDAGFQFVSRHPWIEAWGISWHVGVDGISLLLVIAIVVAVAGILLGMAVYLWHRVRPVEPKLLAEGWYYDQAISEFMGGPGREAFEGTAWFDAHVVDGAVDGTSRSVRGLARVGRKVQSGYVRAYAAVIGLGVVVVLLWFVVVRGLL